MQSIRSLPIPNKAGAPSFAHFAKGGYVGERRRRLNAADIAHFLDLLDGLAIETNLETASRAISDTRALARAHDLSAYDATYLELAMRRNLLLATLDERLKKVTHAVGAALIA